MDFRYFAHAAVVFGLGAQACAQNSEPRETTCNGFEWLLGAWRGSEDEGKYNQESWQRVDSSRLSGTNGTYRNGRLVYTETLAIEIRERSATYRASPQGQATTEFGLQKCGSSWATFTNPAHDWPQSITYRRVRDTLTADVRGVQKGKKRHAQWKWTLKPAEPESDADVE